MSFSAGGNVLSAAMVVVVFSTFIVTLVQAYHVYAERRNAFEHFGLALGLAEQVRDRVSVGGTSTSLGIWLSGQAKTLAREGLRIRVEIRDFQGELLFNYGREPDFMSSYFSPPVGAAIPIVFSKGSILGEPCEITVRVWGV